MNRRLGVSAFFVLGVFAAAALATSNYDYKPGEYVTVSGGKSPDGRYLIATHGEGELGYDNWHVYLMDAVTGKRIGPLEEIKDPLEAYVQNRPIIESILR
jgi:hypothetical protein